MFHDRGDDGVELDAEQLNKVLREQLNKALAEMELLRQEVETEKKRFIEYVSSESDYIPVYGAVRGEAPVMVVSPEKKNRLMEGAARGL